MYNKIYLTRYCLLVFLFALNLVFCFNVSVGMSLLPGVTLVENNGKVVVKEVQSNSLISSIGLKQGDIILEVNGEEIKSLDDYVTRQKSIETKENVKLQLSQNGQKYFINIKNGKYYRKELKQEETKALNITNKEVHDNLLSAKGGGFKEIIGNKKVDNKSSNKEYTVIEKNTNKISEEISLGNIEKGVQGNKAVISDKKIMHEIDHNKNVDKFSSINNQSQNGKIIIICVTIALTIMGGGFALWYFIRQKRLSELYINYWENMVTHKIPHPFSDVFSKEIDVPEYQGKDDSKVFEMAVLGDLFIESCMSVSALQNYLESYGLTQISDSYDLKSSPPAETITRIANKNEMVLDGFGQPIDSDNIPQLVPGSTIDQISSYIQNHPKLFDENIKSFVGYVGETEVTNALKEKGIKAFFADNNAPGFDLYVPKDWLKAKTGIDFLGEVGVLQVKTVNSASSVYRHFSQYLDNGHMIPVLAPNHIVEQLSDHQYRQYLIPFSEVGVNEIPSIISTTSDHIQALATGQYGDVIRHGIEIPELLNEAEALIGSVIRIPLLAVAISSTLSVYRNYKLIQGKKINIVNGVKNIGTDVSYAGAKAGAGLAAGSLANIAVNKVAISMGVPGGTGELAADAYDGIVESLADGISSEDVFNIIASFGTVALPIGGIIAAGYYARKGFDNVVKSVKGNIYKLKTRKMRKIYDNLLV